MATKVLICDDSAMARKQLARALPKAWAVEVTFAGNGEEGLAAIRKGLGEIVFLDLNMPVMDGYQLLQILRDQGPKTRVIVVSGDIQPQAHKRVTALGALAFIKKPADSEKIIELLAQLQIDTTADRDAALNTRDTALSPAKTALSPAKTALSPKKTALSTDSSPRTDSAASPDLPSPASESLRDYGDCYREIANVAMGQAASLLARVLDVYIRLPIPNVNIIELSELKMALTTAESETVSAVCQGFTGSGVAGEALLIFNDSSFSDIATLMKYTGELDASIELELLMDMASILISACLKGIAEQLDVQFSQGHPVVLGRHLPLDNLLKGATWKKTLAIEINYAIENHDIHCDLLILFTEESLAIINNKIAYLFD